VRARGRRLRRARCLVAYWQGAELILENYLTRESVSADLENAAVLQFFSEWRSPQAIHRAMPHIDRANLDKVVRGFERLGLLLREGSPEAARDAQVEKVWGTWLPAAGLLHFSSRDAQYTSYPAVTRWLRKLAREQPAPPLVKRYRGLREIELPAPDRESELAKVLLGRRTWRRFGAGKMALADLATLLWLTWGVQAWIDVPAGRLALKTSPSGGARHPVEVYVLARKVKGLRPGLYHYAPDAHRLRLLRSGASSRQITEYIGGQEWFAGAAVEMLMTAVLPRTLWKYRYAGAYRNMYIDAGHLGQTFCLVAERLGLAPYCTRAPAESKIENDLGIDGVSEMALYVVGAGTRPAGPWTTGGRREPVISTRGLKYPGAMPAPRRRA
jgi:SagB-type dehydrogenase family enzyme